MKSTLSQLAGIKDIASAADYTEGRSPPTICRGRGPAISSIRNRRGWRRRCAGSVTGPRGLHHGRRQPYPGDRARIHRLRPERVGGELPGLSSEISRRRESSVRRTQRAGAPDDLGADGLAAFQGTARFTRGLLATRVDCSRFSGLGVKVASWIPGSTFNTRTFRTVRSQSVLHPGAIGAGRARAPNGPLRDLLGAATADRNQNQTIRDRLRHANPCRRGAQQSGLGSDRRHRSRH